MRLHPGQLLNLTFNGFASAAWPASWPLIGPYFRSELELCRHHSPDESPVMRMRSSRATFGRGVRLPLLVSNTIIQASPKYCPNSFEKSSYDGLFGHPAAEQAIKSAQRRD